MMDQIFDKIPPSSQCQSTAASGINSENKVQTLNLSYNNEQQQEWNEDQSAMFVCRLCNKTFYNAIALQNHKNLHHAVLEDVNSFQDDCYYNNNKNEKWFRRNKELCTFKFLPLNKENKDNTTHTQDGLATRVFSEDTTYIIVKLQGEVVDADASKRRRLEGVVKRTQGKQEKLPVDLRGPFTCTCPLAMRPDLQCRQIFFNCCEYSLHYREEHTKRRKAALRCQVCERRLDRDLLPTPAPAPAPTPEPPPPEPTTFSCRMCGQVFLTGSQYDDHNRLLHSKTKPHQCSLCAKRFTQQGGLLQHMRMHTGIRPFGCSYCPKAFTQKAGLDQHLRTHTKIKPFKCVICAKGFSQSVHLRQHMRTHTNIQPFECYVCGKRFKQTSHLNFHLRSHGVSDDLAPQALISGQGSVQGNGSGDARFYATEYQQQPPASAGPYTFQLQPQPSVEYILHYN